MAEVQLDIAGRTYRVACRNGEEENLRRAASFVDQKSREALAGLGALSEARQLLFAALLLADQLIDKGSSEPRAADSQLAGQADRIASRLESLADALEREATNP